MIYKIGEITYNVEIQDATTNSEGVDEITSFEFVLDSNLVDIRILHDDQKDIATIIRSISDEQYQTLCDDYLEKLGKCYCDGLLI